MAGVLDEKHRESRFDSLFPVATTDVKMGLVNTDNNNNNTRSSSNSSNNHGVPTPPLSPCASMTCLARPPTQGGGPLSSHPTTPTDIPGAWLSTSDLQALARAQAAAALTAAAATTSAKAITPPLNLAVYSSRLSASPSVSADHMEPSRHDSFRTPLTPASANNQRRGSKAIRKLLSLSGLRNSSASNDDAVIIPSSTSPSLSSPNTSNASLLLEDSFREGTVSRGTKRSASTSMSLTPPEDHHQNQPPSSPLRKRKSIGWFRRTSHIFLFGDGENANAQSEPLTKSVSKSEVNMDHDSTAPARRISRIPHLSQSSEDPRNMSTMSNIQPKQRNFTAPELYHAHPPPQSRPHTSQPPQPSEDREVPQIQEPPRTSYTHKAPETFEAAPKLPELDTLGGGSLGGGFLDAEDMFANIGR